ATLLTMCATQGLRAGMVAGVIVNRLQQETPDVAALQQTESDAVTIVVEAARLLLTA
ncbi:uridine phosphorylase, partial [Sodalis-like symbiont of Bactericera trigonica]